MQGGIQSHPESDIGTRIMPAHEYLEIMANVLANRKWNHLTHLEEPLHIVVLEPSRNRVMVNQKGTAKSGRSNSVATG